MYYEVGAFDAKAKLSELLRGVREGHSYTITIRGEPVADLVPTAAVPRHDPLAAIAAMRQIQKVKGVNADEITSWIVEGRQ